MSKTPSDLAAFLDSLAGRTGLARSALEYPADQASLRRAADAFAALAREHYGVQLSVDDADGDQLDRFANAHLVDPRVRPFFDGPTLRGLGEKEDQRYRALSDEIRVPDEPLLYYAMGAFWGEWLVRHRQASWALYPPLRPVQSFPDVVTAAHTVCLTPFSQVVKKLSDPEGDQLSFKAKVAVSDKRRVPPFPLVVSPADAEHAVRMLLPADARAAYDDDQQGRSEESLAGYQRAITAHPDHAMLASLGADVALRLERWDRAEAWLARFVELQPRNPLGLHNLAVVYSRNHERLPRAIVLLERALQEDANYPRAHLTLASCLADSGDPKGARDHAEAVLSDASADAKMKADAKSLIAGLDRGTTAR